ncbi:MULTISPECIES: hypothetical protein [Rhizobium/Agrobacterium group]|uniref:Uncharacterized protein n=1 Tax=Agrobacterium vitis TaxID=373 RepID=A0ABD6HE57_AGRVI|nr:MULTISPECIES: hypothetical protein [Rhizobium/Agrobacterium group]MUO28251.1 hypothetical protein [Agrobacterium vitis]MUO40715.1 hypothetical protein [Agrobacterium vitis]MUP12746.1 hypothetical protein [Agrobacterium vitis]
MGAQCGGGGLKIAEAELLFQCGDKMSAARIRILAYPETSVGNSIFVRTWRERTSRIFPVLIWGNMICSAFIFQGKRSAYAKKYIPFNGMNGAAREI